MIENYRRLQVKLMLSIIIKKLMIFMEHMIDIVKNDG